MAQTFSVKALLSAKDSGFTSTLKSCSNALDKIDSKISGFSFGLLTGAGQAAFSAITGGVSDMVGEINTSSKAWKTFEGNMKNFGKSAKEIQGVKKELQDYATQTVYSASEMAGTFSQLEAVGVGGMKSLAKGTSGLVKGFGGLAAAAENPSQAMKSLSQQATQMAAKPKVAWEDFKIMLEQSPAGMAAVAESMGISTSQLIKKIQAGEMSTEKFFAAVEKAGNSEGFQKMATEAKTVDQAMDGLKESIGNKLLPTFEVLSQQGIQAIDKISSKLSGINGQQIATKVLAFVKKAQKYFTVFKESFSGVWDSIKTAASSIKKSFTDINGAFGSTEHVDKFKGVMDGVASVIKKVADFATTHADAIAKLISYLPQILIAIKGFKIAKTVAPFVGMFASGISNLASKGIGGIASKLFGIGKAQETVGQASATSGTSMLTAAKSYALMGVAVLAIAAGFALLAFSAIQLSNAGGLAIGVMAGLVVGVAALGVGMALLLKFLAPMGAQLMPVATAMLLMGTAVLVVAAGFAILSASAIALSNAGGLAIGVMVGMVATIALLAVGAAALAPALTAGAVGLIAFGAAMVLVGAGAVLAGAALAIVSAVLPSIVAHGTAGATAIVALGASMVVFAAGATLAGVAALALGAGLVVLGAGAIVAGAGMVVFGAGVVVASAGLVVMAGSLKLVSSQMKDISKNAKKSESSLKSMQSSVKLVESGLNALESKAKSALNTLKNAFDNSAKNAKTSGQNVGKWFAQAMQSGLKSAVNNVKTTTRQMKAELDNAAKNAKTAGKNVGSGFSASLKSGLAAASTNAKAAVSSVNTALKGGYDGAYSAGEYISKGFATGMSSQLETVKSTASKLAAAAEKAIEAKAKIASPSKVTTKLGQFFGEGFVNGIASMIKSSWKTAQELVSIPSVATPNLAFAGGFEMSGDYDYYRNAQYVVEVPLSVDGKEFARATASYTQEELNRQQSRNSRKRGKV